MQNVVLCAIYLYLWLLFSQLKRKHGFLWTSFLFEDVNKENNSMIFTSVISLLLGKLFKQFVLKIFKNFVCLKFLMFEQVGWFLPKFFSELT